VACYVVNPETQKSKRHKMYEKQEEICRFQKKTADFVELLPRFELGTSSLPTDSKPSERRFPALWGPFCSGRAWSLTLSRPLIPPARFPMWVTVWVK